MSLTIEAGSKAILVTPDRDQEIASREIVVYQVGYPERLDGLPEGIYRCDGEVFSFDVGGATDYYAFLELLSRTILGLDLATIRNNPQAHVGRAFMELLDFSDNEGAMGPKSSAKLARDFALHNKRLKHHVTNVGEQVGSASGGVFQLLKHFVRGRVGERQRYLDPTRFTGMYDDFQRAFELAADRGFVVFQ